MVLRAAGWQLPSDGTVRSPTLPDRANLETRRGSYCRVGSACLLVNNTETRYPAGHAIDSERKARSERRQNRARRSRSQSAKRLPRLREGHCCRRHELCRLCGPSFETTNVRCGANGTRGFQDSTSPSTCIRNPAPPSRCPIGLAVIEPTRLAYRKDLRREDQAHLGRCFNFGDSERTRSFVSLRSGDPRGTTPTASEALATSCKDGRDFGEQPDRFVKLR
jgi:hypothetical protein